MMQGFETGGGVGAGAGEVRRGEGESVQGKGRVLSGCVKCFGAGIALGTV
jgi:hypothetical protein